LFGPESHYSAFLRLKNTTQNSNLKKLLNAKDTKNAFANHNIYKG